MPVGWVESQQLVWSVVDGVTGVGVVWWWVALGWVSLGGEWVSGVGGSQWYVDFRGEWHHGGNSFRGEWLGHTVILYLVFYGLFPPEDPRALTSPCAHHLLCSVFW